MTRRMLPIILSVAACVSVSAQNWPSFRGPQASGVADGAPTQVTWNVATSQNVLWKTPIAGLAVSSGRLEAAPVPHAMPNYDECRALFRPRCGPSAALLTVRRI